ncbi:hypothetical protein [Saccharothrix sp. HUAS TT1]|uniref:hypothetical protein n=1 Tax=unclassified Saccharothrix TaxID=2593673 RepID=UPI00345B501D
MNSTDNPTRDADEHTHDAAGARADAVLLWVPAALRERGVVLALTGLTGSVDLDFGDGTDPVRTAAGAPPIPHTYTTAGRAYLATAWQDGDLVAEAQIVVRAGLAPAVTFATAADNPNIVEATVTADPADLVSRYEFTWGVDGPVETLYAPKGTVLRHGFHAGTHTITVRDLHTGRVSSTDVEVTDLQYDPDFDLSQGADVRTAQLTVTASAEAKELLIDWGDGEQSTIPAPADGDTNVGQKRSHTYTRDDTYIVQLVYSDGSTDGSSKTVTIPFPAPPATGDDTADRAGKAGRR